MGVRIWLGILLGLLVASGALPQAGRAGITTSYASTSGFHVAAGVDYDFGSVIVGGSARRSINIIELDPASWR